MSTPTLPKPDTSTLDIQGTHCASCVGRIERALKRVPGVTDAAVNLATNRASVAFDPAQANVEAMIAAVEKSGYGAAPISAAKPDPTVGGAPRDWALLNLIAAAVLTVPVVLLSLTWMMRPMWAEWTIAALATIVVFGFGREIFSALGAPCATAGRRRWIR